MIKKYNKQKVFLTEEEMSSFKKYNHPPALVGTESEHPYFHTAGWQRSLDW